MLDDLTLHPYDDLFKMNKAELRSYERKDSTWTSVTLEMDLSLQTYERTVYTLFDLLSDIGGLSGILFSFFLLMNNAWNFNRFDNMLVSRLFKIKPGENEQKPPSEDLPEIDLGCMPNCTDYLLSFLPGFLTCCRRGRRQRAL